MHHDHLRRGGGDGHRGEALHRIVRHFARHSRRDGDGVLAAIAEDYTWNGRRYPGTALAYLTEAMRYRFGGPELTALNRFLAAAARTGEIDEAPEIRIAVLSPTACR